MYTIPQKFNLNPKLFTETLKSNKKRSQIPSHASASPQQHLPPKYKAKKRQRTAKSIKLEKFFVCSVFFFYIFIEMS